MLTLTWRRTAALALGVVLLAGCSVAGGDDGQDGGAPGTAVPTPASGPAATPAGIATGEPDPAAGGKRPSYTFPVDGRARFGWAHHDYPATDIFAACGTGVLAPTSGRITFVSRRDDWSGGTDRGAERGGISWALVGDDGVRYYGSHLRWLRGSIEPGARIGGGALIGRVGDTGSAAGTGCHLHFGISPDCGTSDWWTRRGAVRPYRFLTAWQRGESLSPVAAVAEWKGEHGCPEEP